MTDKITIENLPVTEKVLSKKRLIQDRGELALIEDGKGFQHLGYLNGPRQGVGF